jgi:hypothetical protein
MGDTDGQECQDPHWFYRGWPWRRTKVVVRCGSCRGCISHFERIAFDAAVADVERALAAEAHKARRPRHYGTGPG